MIILLDTETTDKERDSRLVQLAYKIRGGDGEVNEYFKPPAEIEIGAMAVHHITNEMVEDKPAFDGSEDKEKITKLLSDGGIMVAHNAAFDINILKNEGVETQQFIDTFRLSQHLIDSERYALQYLRYFLKLNITDGKAHDAMGDVNVLEALFEHLVIVTKEKYGIEGDKELIAKMIELTNTPVLIKKFLFGKYFGRTFENIAEVDKNYLKWLYRSETEKDLFSQNEDMVYTLEHYLGIDKNKLPF